MKVITPIRYDQLYYPDRGAETPDAIMLWSLILYSISPSELSMLSPDIINVFLSKFNAIEHWFEYPRPASETISSFFSPQKINRTRIGKGNWKM
jgi:hypothetical protein